MNIFKTRNDFINSLASNMVVCELGVFQGDFSEVLFLHNPKELHLIDPFVGAFWSGDKDGLNMQYANLSESYYDLQTKYSTHNHVHIHKGYSYDILINFPDYYFDFMYIDADHTYNGVKNDLILCKQKTKINGIIAGHDYHESRFPGVVQAVEEFCDTHSLPISFLTNDGCPSFGIINL